MSFWKKKISLFENSTTSKKFGYRAGPAKPNETLVLDP